MTMACSNTGLTTLDISHAGVGREAAEALKRLLAGRMGLRRLEITGIWLDIGVMQAAARALKNNRYYPPQSRNTRVM